MGPLYSVSIITPGAISAGAAAAVIRSANATAASRPRIKRIAIVVHGSPANSFVDLYRVTSANYGTQNVTVLGQGLVTADTASTSVDTGWSAAPSLPGTPVRLDGVSIAGTIGNGAIITFPSGDGLVLEPNTALLLWCPSPGAGQLRITPVWEE